MKKICQAYIPRAYQLAYQEVDYPVISPGNVLIRVYRIGICGSDIHAFKGKHPLVSFPLIQGHELSGYVEEVGEGVESLKVGDLVTVEPAIGCGSCPKCQQGLIAQCEKLQFIGGNLPGGGNQFIQVNSRYVIRFSPEVNPDDAAMTEPLAVAVHAVNKVPSVRGKKIFIAGGGTIGLLVAQMCRFLGADEIIISEKLTFRNQIATALGFATITPDERLIEKVKEMFHSCPSITFECVGSENPLNTCIRLVERGGYVMVVGVYEEPPRTEMVLVQDKEINMIGTLMYSLQDFHKAAELITLKQIQLQPLQTHHFPFHQWSEAYQFIENPNNSYLKVFIDVSANEQCPLKIKSS